MYADVCIQRYSYLQHVFADRLSFNFKGTAECKANLIDLEDDCLKNVFRIQLGSAP